MNRPKLNKRRFYTPPRHVRPPQIKEIEKASARLEIRVTPVGRRTIGENEMASKYAQREELARVKAVTEDQIASSLGRYPCLDDAEHKR